MCSATVASVPMPWRHEADQVTFRQAWRVQGGSLELTEAQLSRHGQTRVVLQAKLCLRKVLHACFSASNNMWDSSCKLYGWP